MVKHLVGDPQWHDDTHTRNSFNNITKITVLGNRSYDSVSCPNAVSFRQDRNKPNGMAEAFTIGRMVISSSGILQDNSNRFSNVADHPPSNN
jgi:hypothetical protein